MPPLDPPLYVSNPNGPFDVYQFKAVLFSTISSPFISYATLYQHLQQYNTSLSHDILHNLYVDNILSGHSSEEEIIQYYHRLYIPYPGLQIDFVNTFTQRRRIVQQFSISLSRAPCL